MTGDRAELADFLRTRREALQPEDVGMPRGRAPAHRRAAPRGGRRPVRDVRRLLQPHRAAARPAPERADARRAGPRAAAVARRARPPVPARRLPVAAPRGCAPTTSTPGSCGSSTGSPTRPRWSSPARRDAGADPARGGALRRRDRVRRAGAQRGLPLVHRPRRRARSTPRRTAPCAAGDFTADLRHAYTRDGRGSRAAEIVDALTAASAEFRPCGPSTRWPASTARPSGSRTPRSGCWSCTARPSTTWTRARACSCSRPRRAARAPRSCGCWRCSGGSTI